MGASDHRSRARAALQGNWAAAVAVCLLAGIISGTGFKPSISINFNGGDLIRVKLPDQMEELFHEILGIGLPILMLLSMTMLVVGLILGGVMEVGKARYHLNLIDGTDPQLEDLFCAFPCFSQALVMKLLRDLLIFLGMLLLVPGVILTYSYAMAPYILAQDPQCSGTDALRLSRELMQGHKLELFFLELSFFGWMLLAALTFGIGDLFLAPYREASRASFFRSLTDGSQQPPVEF